MAGSMVDVHVRTMLCRLAIASLKAATCITGRVPGAWVFCGKGGLRWTPARQEATPLTDTQPPPGPGIDVENSAGALCGPAAFPGESRFSLVPCNPALARVSSSVPASPPALSIGAWGPTPG